MPVQTREVLAECDVSDMIGLRSIVHGAAIRIVDADGEGAIEVPDVETASASVAMARCLMPIRLQAREIRAIRRIVGMTATDLASAMESNPETVSRWENDKQSMGGYAEKIFRLVICERLKERAPGVDYTDGAIANLRVLDPWRCNPAYEVPYINLERVRVRSEHKHTISAWSADLPKAA